MTNSLVSAIALAALAGTVTAQSSIDYRIVERTGQTEANAVDGVLDLAIQARVNGGAALGGFGFNAVIPGEPDANGTLQFGRITDGLGNYVNTFGVGGVVGQHGLAKQYSYLAGISSAFNGQINLSNGTFTNTPGNQEIGLITGSALGGALTGAPGFDPDGEGNPSTWSGYGVGAIPPAGATATLPAAIGATYFAQGQFIDIYRFRYTVTNFANRALVFTLEGLTSQTFNSLAYAGGQWGIDSATFTGQVNLTPLTVQVVPAPASAALLGLGGLVAARRRRTA
ncbi:MAG TPA: PEP-CTERM sorting domain-containing protein [Phycisphaerales bacterium]|nr:PEP-CTERM sorting domain-containing protein [Phycisphaerales bacterium]